MQIALCITGFARTVHTSEVIRSSIQRSLPLGSTIDLFWYCPTRLDPDDLSDLVDTAKLIEAFENTKIFRRVCIEFFEYTPSIFYEETRRLRFSVADLVECRSVPRTLSQVYNISKSVELAYASQNTYDVVIITRNDYIPHVITYGIPSPLKQGIYAYRTSPYRTTTQQVGMGDDLLDTEDRAFYGTHDDMVKFRQFYQQLHTVFTSPRVYPEILHTKFIRSLIPEERIYYQDGVHIEFPPNRTDPIKHKLTSSKFKFINGRFCSDRLT
jgi:hypothetical protein